MRELWLYGALSRLGWLNYKAKIMVMAFVGTHVPLIALIGFFAIRDADDWQAVLSTVGVALAATLVGTGVTLYVLHHLLRPVMLTARGLRSYRETRIVPELPTGFRDEVGALMSDAAQTLTELDAALAELEFTDRATGLANRTRLVMLLDRAKADGEPAALCAVQIVNHDRIGASFDSQSASRAMRSVADRIAAEGELTHPIARIHSDTLAFIVTDPGDAKAGWTALTSTVARAIRAASADLMIAGNRIRPELRAGIALFPGDAEDSAVVIDHAITASRGAVVEGAPAFHAPAHRAAARERFLLEQELRRAIDDDQFVLHYQPVIDLSLGRPVGAEALIRWQHPERGQVPPGLFIPAAERSGLIDPIGLWVMRRACQQIREWNSAGLSSLKIAINLSARQFLDPRLTDIVREALDESGVDASQLEIELTETAAMSDHAYTRAVFGRLRDLGVSIAIDDFGTGYASMSYLRKLPFDKLKIDREFVANVHTERDSQAICSALVRLAAGLDLEILAEGTEQEAEVRHLKAAGCNLFQGYYFSKPLPADELSSSMLDLTRRTMHFLADGGGERQMEERLSA